MGKGSSHLPATDTQQEANHIGLLLLLDLFDVLEGTHLDSTVSLSDTIQFARSSHYLHGIFPTKRRRERTLSAWLVVGLSS